MSSQQFLKYVPPPPRRRVVREVAVALLNYYFSAKPPMSRSRWEKVPAQPVSCFEESKDATGNPVRREWDSQPISLRIFEESLESGTFDYARFDLVDPSCNWLDATVHGGPMFHVAGNDGRSLRFQMPTTLGATFPLIPTLDREGYAFNSFQTLLLERIFELRDATVVSSQDFASAGWFQNLRAFICESV